jgi:predicted GTPase
MKSKFQKQSQSILFYKNIFKKILFTDFKDIFFFSKKNKQNLTHTLRSFQIINEKKKKQIITVICGV